MFSLMLRWNLPAAVCIASAFLVSAAGVVCDERPVPVVQMGHHDAVTSLAFSPDGTVLASGSKDGTIRIWRVASGELQRVLMIGDSVSDVAFSPDGGFLAAAVGRQLGSNGGVELWDWRNGTISRKFAPLPGGGSSVAFSPNGRLIAGGSNGICGPGPIEANVWEVTTGKLMHSLRHPGSVHGVAFSPDGKVLACSTYEEVRLWDVASGRRIREMGRKDFSFSDVTFTRDGRKLVAAGFRLYQWDVRTGRRDWQLSSNSGGFIAAAVSPDGKLVAGGIDRSRAGPLIVVVDAASGAVRYELDTRAKAVRAAAFSPDGRLLATAGDDGNIVFRDAHSGDLKRPLKDM